jgi:predicted DNA-binding protein (MmcQ/YjbR family)
LKALFTRNPGSHTIYICKDIIIFTMDRELLREYCLGKPGVTESFPFDENTLVFKVAGKMFLLTDLLDSFSMNVKCDPEKAIDLREHYSCVLPGYHMNKKYWNTIMIDGSINDILLFEWIDHSYDLVVESLPRKERLILRGDT